MGFCLRFGPQIPFSEQQVAGKFPAKTKQGINSRKQGTAIEQQGSALDFEVIGFCVSCSDNRPLFVFGRRSDCVLI
jgi:hypothetical protein